MADDNKKVNRQLIFAAALKHQENQSSKMVAQGYGETAKIIEAAARANQIPVLRDFALSKQLSEIPLGSEIPQALFVAIASVLGYLLEADKNFRG